MTTQAEAALQALESWSRNDYERRQALRITLSEPEKHEDWCDSVTKMLTSLPPKPAPCNCKRAEPKQDDTALLRQALEALEQVASAMPFPVARATITALRERLGEKT